MAQSTADKIQTYKNGIDKLRQSNDQAKGALETKMASLKEFGFDNIEDAQKQIKKWDKEITDLDDKIEAEIKSFEKSYGEYL